MTSKKRILILGGRGGFSHAAAKALGKIGAEIVYANSFDDAPKEFKLGIHDIHTTHIGRLEPQNTMYGPVKKR